MIIFRIQQIDRNIYKELIENLQFIDEFEWIYKGFKLVDSLDDPKNTPEMFRIYARNVPSKEASSNFICSIGRIHSKNNRNKGKSIY